MNSIATAIPNGRTDTSIADDFNVPPGTVSSRVALLLRSTEVLPAAASMCYLSEIHPPQNSCMFRTRGCSDCGYPWGICRGPYGQTVSPPRNQMRENEMREIPTRAVTVCPYDPLRRDQRLSTLSSAPEESHYSSRTLSPPSDRAPPVFFPELVAA